jgi:hypothetical protein
MSELATACPADTPTSPLVLCDRLIALAKQADSAGYAATADHLVRLAHSMFDDKAPRPRRRRYC